MKNRLEAKMDRLSAATRSELVEMFRAEGECGFCGKRNGFVVRGYIHPVFQFRDGKRVMIDVLVIWKCMQCIEEEE